MVLLLACPAFADELRLDARTLLQKSVSRDLRLSLDGTIELERGVLFEDDGPAAGFSYKPNEEKLSAGLRIKKQLIIPNPRASKATLLVGPGGALQAEINGKAQELRKEGKAGNYWEKYAFSPTSLQPGKNEIVLSGSGKVWIARDDEFAAGSRTITKHPNRSAKSGDGGKTWDYERLGTNGNIDGEYCVRVFLDQHRPHGTLTLPVVDLGNLGGKVVAVPVSAVGPVRVHVDALVVPPSGGAGSDRLKAELQTGITVRFRSGPSIVPDDKTWSAWQELKGDIDKPTGRFLQVALELTTSDPLWTPKLKQVLIEAAPRIGDDWTQKLRIVESHNEEIVRSSIPFEYEPFDQPRLKSLRETHKLDEVVKGAKGELDLLGRLAAWSSRQWERGHLKDIYPAWDALEILKLHTDGQPVGGFCQQYNLVFLQACESFGFVGRAVSIGPGDGGVKLGGGHEVVEIWSNEHKKWVYIDGNTAWYFVDEASKTPLSLWELRQRQLRALKGEPFAPPRIVPTAQTRHEWKGLTGWPPFLELRLIPRSNFLQQKAPLPLNQGMRGWFWTGHHAWTDEQLPASLLYGQCVSQRGNWEWTLNQAHYYLEAADKPGELRVHLDTETPGFETFLAETDGGGTQPVKSGFIWKLHKGTNRLEVRPRNLVGRDGIPSRLVLDWAGP